jgi:hypothetical protein
MRWLFCLLLIAVALPLSAHQRPISFSTWEIEETQITAAIYLSALGRWRLYPGERLDEHLQKNIHLFAGDQACKLATPIDVQRAGTRILAALHFNCAGRTPDRIQINAFYNYNPEHLHIATIGDQEYLLDNQEREVLLRGQPSMFTYLWIGVDHILTGYDHLAFILGLLLICGGLRAAIICITGFTIGHSLTLCLAYLGAVTPNTPAVEALVGYSIAIVAIERSSLQYSIPLLLGIGFLALLTLSTAGAFTFPMIIGITLLAICYLCLAKEQKWRAWVLPIVAISFGLLHGFAFAGFLTELRIPRQDVLLALFQFNVGVEIGQIAVASLLYLGVRTILRHSFTQDAIAGGLCGLGVFWFITRSLGV